MTHARSNESYAAGFGLLAGLCLGLILAPRSGKESYSQIKSKAKQAAITTRDSSAMALEKASTKLKSAKDIASEEASDKIEALQTKTAAKSRNEKQEK